MPFGGPLGEQDRLALLIYQDPCKVHQKRSGRAFPSTPLTFAEPESRPEGNVIELNQGYVDEEAPPPLEAES